MSLCCVQGESLCPFVVCRESHCVPLLCAGRVIVKAQYNNPMGPTKCLNNFFIIFNYNMPDSQIFLNCRIK